MATAERRLAEMVMPVVVLAFAGTVKPSFRSSKRKAKNVALYKDGSKLTKSDHNAFDVDQKPGTVVNNSGIYRCINCDDEIAANKGNPLPSQNHAQHAPGKPIIWRLLVCAVQKK